MTRPPTRTLAWIGVAILLVALVALIIVLSSHSGSGGGLYGMGHAWHMIRGWKSP